MDNILAEYGQYSVRTTSSRYFGRIWAIQRQDNQLTIFWQNMGNTALGPLAHDILAEYGQYSVRTTSSRYVGRIWAIQRQDHQLTIFRQNMGNTALGPPAHDPHMNGAEIIWVGVHHLLAADFKRTFDQNPKSLLTNCMHFELFLLLLCIINFNPFLTSGTHIPHLKRVFSSPLG